MNENTASVDRTHASIFLRLNSADSQPRELAWNDFARRYEPVIAGFLRSRGVHGALLDEISQDVMVGFFAASPRFVYDPEKGRFRAFLRTCTLNAWRKHMARNRPQGVSLDSAPEPAEPEVDEAWDREWEQQRLRRALRTVREYYRKRGSEITFDAFDRYVMKQVDAEEVAKQLGIQVASVHQAKSRVVRHLRAEVDQMTAEEG